MIRQTLKILKAFNSNDRPWQLSLGLVFGAIMGLTPLANLHNLLLLFLALVINLNFSLMMVSWGIFSGFAYVLDPVFHQIGYGLLTGDSLQAMWTKVFSCPIAVISNLNNTLVLGSLAVSLLGAIPIFFLFNILLVKYRDRLNEIMERFPLLKSLKLLKSYDTLTQN